MAWGDYDGDGDLDLVVTGERFYGNYVGEVYRNDASGGLTLDAAASAVVADVGSGSLAWGDYDGDGDLDLVVTGERGIQGVGNVGLGEVYRNDGAGGFTLDAAASADVADVSESSVAWGDYDGDGDLDLVVTGYSNSSGFVGEVYENDGAGGLTLDEAASAVVRDVFRSSVAWGDYDGDGDLDLVLIAGGVEFECWSRSSGNYIGMTGRAGSRSTRPRAPSSPIAA